LLGAPKNTIWRWEAGKARPVFSYAGRLCEIAEREPFLDDWTLAGSVTLLSDLETARQEIARLFRESIYRTSRQLAR
jgi:hypothetical protein